MQAWNSLKNLVAAGDFRISVNVNGQVCLNAYISCFRNTSLLFTKSTNCLYITLDKTNMYLIIVEWRINTHLRILQMYLMEDVLTPFYVCSELTLY